MMDPYVYSEEETRQISAAVLALTEEIARGSFRGRPLDVALMVELHRRMLGEVRPDGAGRLRSKTWGAEHLEFGPNRSTRRDQVAAELEALFEQARRVWAGLNETRGLEAGVELAVWLHAELIRIHPFFDGNGRTSRFMMNIALESMGIGCVAVEVVKKEYNHALNAYFASTPPTGAPFGHPALAPLVALVIECYGWQAPT